MAAQMNIVALTAEIVSSYVSNNRVTVEEIGDVIWSVAGALAALDVEETVLHRKRADPAVPISRSVQPDYLVNLFTGQKFKTLKHTLSRVHGMTPREYRAYWGLPGNYPMVAPNYSVQRRDMAKANGLGTRIVPNVACAMTPREEMAAPSVAGHAAESASSSAPPARKRTLSLKT
ncbi:MAG: MucR family transcriptional regulator [Sphingomonas sp.]|uniref:MucR family transcriptional regulator n=1 Tax=Sphingomonas sp. TaxID=28214 RepID=UPI00356AA676